MNICARKASCYDKWRRSSSDDNAWNSTSDKDVRRYINIKHRLEEVTDDRQSVPITIIEFRKRSILYVIKCMLNRLGGIYIRWSSPVKIYR